MMENNIYETDIRKEDEGKIKVTLELPDKTTCVFVNYVFITSIGMSMVSKSIDTDALKSGRVVDCRVAHPTEKGGVE